VWGKINSDSHPVGTAPGDQPGVVMVERRGESGGGRISSGCNRLAPQRLFAPSEVMGHGMSSADMAAISQS
jgi:hypothetical protein